MGLAISITVYDAVRLLRSGEQFFDGFRDETAFGFSG